MTDRMMSEVCFSRIQDLPKYHFFIYGACRMEDQQAIIRGKYTFFGLDAMGKKRRKSTKDPGQRLVYPKLIFPNIDHAGPLAPS